MIRKIQKDTLSHLQMCFTQAINVHQNKQDSIMNTIVFLVPANPVDVINISTDLLSEVITNGFFFVDSFFFMTGVLITFAW